jgi:hypothetical protein
MTAVDTVELKSKKKWGCTFFDTAPFLWMFKGQEFVSSLAFSFLAVCTSVLSQNSLIILS